MGKTVITILVVCIVVLTSCDTYWPGMGGYGGYGGYGNMGMYGNPYAAPFGVLPYHLRPDVYAANAYQQGMAKIQAEQQQMAESAKRLKEQIEADAAYRVRNGLPPVTVVEPVSSSSTSSSSSSTSRSSETSTPYIQYGYKDCRQCLGSGRCKTCNGTGLQSEGFGVGKIPCGVCSNHSGKCTSCGGSGKQYGAL